MTTPAKRNLQGYLTPTVDGLRVTSGVRAPKTRTLSTIKRPTPTAPNLAANANAAAAGTPSARPGTPAQEQHPQKPSLTLEGLQNFFEKLEIVTTTLISLYTLWRLWKEWPHPGLLTIIMLIFIPLSYASTYYKLGPRLQKALLDAFIKRSGRKKAA